MSLLKLVCANKARCNLITLKLLSTAGLLRTDCNQFAMSSCYTNVTMCIAPVEP